MFENLCCPECLATFKVPAEDMGLVGKCRACGLPIRFATPMAIRVGPAPKSPPTNPVNENEWPDTPVPLNDPEEDWPDKPLLLDEPWPVKKVNASPQTSAASMSPQPTAPGSRRRSTLRLAAIALVVLMGGTTGGVLLNRQLTTSAENDDAIAESNPHVSQPTPVQPQQPSEPQPQPPPQATQTPIQPKTDPKTQGIKVKLPDSVVAAYPGGGGQFLVLQLANGQLTLYDAVAGVTTWTVSGYDAGTLVAVGREKMFVCRPNDLRITRFDLHSGEAERIATQRVMTELMTIGSGSDGPLLFITRNPNGPGVFRIRLLSGETLTDFKLPLDDPDLPNAVTIPFNSTTRPARIAMSVDGRSFTLGPNYFVRRGDVCWGGKLPNGSLFVPGPDGRSFVGSTLCDKNGQALAFAPPPAGFERLFFPVGGPFVASVEYDGHKPSTVKLFLHAGEDHLSLGSLPCSDEVRAWAADDSTWLTRLPQRLFFVPNPGRLIFLPPGSAAVLVFPIDLPAMLERSEHKVLFTSIPSADVRTGKGYLYRATAVAAQGPVRYTLEKGPSGMTMTPEGVLTWPDTGTFRGTETEVRITARDAQGRTANQNFQLLIPREGEP